MTDAEGFIPEDLWGASVCRIKDCAVPSHVHPIPPDPERDARVAARRAEDARRAGLALDRLLSQCDGLGCRCCGNLQRLTDLVQSELHHNGHYDVSLPTGGEMSDAGQPPPCPDHAADGNQLSCAWCGEERAAFYRRLGEVPS